MHIRPEFDDAMREYSNGYGESICAYHDSALYTAADDGERVCTDDDKAPALGVKDLARLAYEKTLADPSLTDMQAVLVRLCMAELDAKDGLVGLTLTTAEMDVLTNLVAREVATQTKEE